MYIDTKEFYIIINIIIVIPFVQAI